MIRVVVRFITISSEFCRFNGPFLHLWHHQIHICIDRLCRCLSGEAITLKGHSVSFPALHFSLLLRQRWEHQAPLPFLVTSLSGRVESVTVGIGNRERNSLQRKRLAGISASLLLCCCYRRVATACEQVTMWAQACVQGGNTPFLASGAFTAAPRGPSVASSPGEMLHPFLLERPGLPGPLALDPFGHFKRGH